MVNLEIDGKKIVAEEGTNVLRAALDGGIYIPHVCHHPDLPELSSCRLCVVKVEGMEGIHPSCSLTVEEGMKVTTKDDEITHVRNLAMELMLGAHPEDCSTCPKYGRCELQTTIQYMGVSAGRMRTRVKGLKSLDHKLLVHDMNRCVLCGRCVRACRDLRDVGVLHYNKKDNDTEVYIGTLQKKLLMDTDCRFCGACAEVCPTGSIRDYIDYIAVEKKDVLLPCKAECPVHTDIPEYIRFVKNGEYAKADAVIHEKIPFPESLGRVCNHVCEGKCRRGQLNEAISIRNIKRYSAENDEEQLWVKNGFRREKTGKKVCVVGGGPSGMTAAYYLAKLGHEVTVKEQFEKFGGQLQFGIPAYRLPREVVDKEMNYTTLFGVTLEPNCRIDHPIELLDEYDAVLMAIGTHNGVRLPMPGSDFDGVLINSDYLRNASRGLPTGQGERIVVLGGGNVAFDCARTAVREGAKEVHLACLESRDIMLADDEEIDQATEEGVHVYPGCTFEEILGDGKVAGVHFGKVKSFSFDENKRAIIEKEEGADFEIPCDTVIFATGQRTLLAEDSGLERGRGDCIVTPNFEDLKTNVEGIFACGDAIYGTKTVIMAVSSGRLAASQIDQYLGGDGAIEETLVDRGESDPHIGKIEGFAQLERREPELRPVESRSDDFDQLDEGLCEEAACGEAQRCLQCDLRFQIHTPDVWSDYTIS